MLIEWRGINQHLSSLYKKLELDIGEILSRNSELDNENTELINKLQAEKAQNNGLMQSITMLRAELAKNQSELAKSKEGLRKLKELHRQKLTEKEEVID